MAYNNEPRCDTCREPMSSHPSCCRTHPFSKHRDTCPNRPREILQEKHQQRPPDCLECGQTAIHPFWCWKCGWRIDAAVVMTWHPTKAEHEPKPLRSVQEQINAHRRECGLGSVVWPYPKNSPRWKA